MCGRGGPEVNHVKEGTPAKMSMIIKGEERTTKNETGYFTYFFAQNSTLRKLKVLNSLNKKTGY